MKNITNIFTNEAGERIIIINESSQEKGKKMFPPKFNSLRNVSISDVMRMGKTIDFLLETVGEGLFTSKEYERWDNISFVNLSTLRKHNFVKINHVTERQIFTVKDNWNTTVVDMTIEQYNNLPDFFKDQVSIETHKTNHYELDISRCCDFMLIHRHLINAFGPDYV